MTEKKSTSEKLIGKLNEANKLAKELSEDKGGEPWVHFDLQYRDGELVQVKFEYNDDAPPFGPTARDSAPVTTREVIERNLEQERELEDKQAQADIDETIQDNDGSGALKITHPAYKADQGVSSIPLTGKKGDDSGPAASNRRPTSRDHVNEQVE